MRTHKTLKTITAGLVIAAGLFIASPTDSSVMAAPTKVMWGKTELKLGQIGKTTILKETPLVKINADGSLSTVRMLKKGDEFRTYQYKGQHGGLYGVGSASFIQKSSAIKYETPSKSKLALVAGGSVSKPNKPVTPPSTETATKEFKTFEQLKTIATNLYNSSEFQPKEVVVYTTTDMEGKFSDYVFSSMDVSQDISGYTFYGRLVRMDVAKVKTGVYKNTFYIYNDREKEDQLVWDKRLAKAEKYIVANYSLNTDYDVVYAINHFVSSQLEYGIEVSEDHEFIGYMGAIPTCTQYTDLMAALLESFGIESRIATGDAHAWNAVKVGGEWYWSDATFADSTGEKEFYTLMTQTERQSSLNDPSNPIETTFKATDNPFNQSMAKPYNYSAVKKAQASKK